ncbi:hypothetical protein [Agromyces allii]|uniref:Uncharacterized protein n=1 Tax=Agromyces allii TaxID=393607 RepID=A0ABP5BZD5_9MICO|nr:hypothetical protein [Agromyces allii]
MAEELSELDATERGRFAIFTESGSIYEIEISGNAARLCRHPNADTGSSSLYRDNETIELHDFTAAVGQSAAFKFLKDDPTLSPDYFATFRLTTPVVRIIRLEWE